MNIHQNLENKQWEHFSEKGEKYLKSIGTFHKHILKEESYLKQRI